MLLMRSAAMVILCILAILPGLARGEDSSRQLSMKSLEECNRGRAAKERAARLAHFERSQVLAERAVELNDELADAHFALFCSLGEQLRIDGENLTSVFGFRRVMRELDRTLELDPHHLDAMSSKGTFLMRLPSFLGGDSEKGEQMLHYVILHDPKSVNARLTLAKTYASRGKRSEALSLATQALDLAHAEGRADLIPEAETTVMSLRNAQSGRSTFSSFGP
jgi:tetratricopeptide (TPR) repeat protein